MTAAYAAFANQGRVPKPVVIRRVEDREGLLLYEAQPTSARAVSETTAFLMSTMMADVINAGTAAGARTLGFKLPAAGKTGTTNDYHDAWFIGYTPKLVTGVWVGFDQPRTILPEGYASDVADPLWAAFMKSATQNDEPEWFKTPRGVSTASVCRISGKLAGEGCEHVDVIGRNGEAGTRSMVYTEYFASGSRPTEYCQLHSGRGIFAAFAGLFSEKPPPPRVEEDVVAARPSDASGTVGAPGAPGSPEATADVEPAPETPVKKRGFWSRLLGRGKDDKN
jgi:penicillin-binding protein 1A